MKVTIKSVRLGFPALHTPKPVGEGTDLRYSAAFPIAPGSANAKAIDAAIAAAAKEKWNAKADTIVAQIVKKGNSSYTEEDLCNGNGEVYGGFEDMYALNATSKARPTVIDRDRTPLVEADGKPYGGCYVNAIVDIWAQDNNFGKRINCQLQGIQFVKDGEAFGGGGVASADEFEELEDIEGEDDDFV